MVKSKRSGSARSLVGPVTRSRKGAGRRSVRQRASSVVFDAATLGAIAQASADAAVMSHCDKSTQTDAAYSVPASRSVKNTLRYRTRPRINRKGYIVATGPARSVTSLAAGKARMAGGRKRRREYITRIGGKGDYKEWFNKIAKGARNTFGRVGDEIKAAGRQYIPDGTFNSMGMTAGAKLGMAFGGGPLSALAGGIAGGNLGNTISKLVGFGDYAVSANSLMGRVPMGMDVPAFGNMSNGTIVRHREYIADVTNGNTGSFNNQSFIINPALPGTFPWLSQLASNYQQYRFRGLVFEFISTTSEYSGTAAMGTVCLCTNYDSGSVNTLYTSKQQAENSQFAVSNKPSLDILHPIECDPRITNQPIKYTRQAPPSTNQDIRDYDWGVFQLVTQGITASTNTIGELWVSYEVELLKPSIAVIGPGSADHFQLTVQIASVSGTSNYFGATAVLYKPTITSTIGSTLTNSTITLPTGLIGNFLFVYTVYGAATTLTTQMTCSVTNASKKALLLSDVTGTRADNAATTMENWLEFDQFFSISSTQAATGAASLTLTAGTLPASLTDGDVFLIVLPSSLS